MINKTLIQVTMEQRNYLNSLKTDKNPRFQDVLDVILPTLPNEPTNK